MMKILLKLILKMLRDPKKDFDLALENLALRQQLAVMKRSIKRPQLRSRHRLFWVLLSRFWTRWQQTLIIVQPETVIRWHRKSLKLYWKFKSRRKGPGRPPISREIRDLIRTIAKVNPLLGGTYNPWRAAKAGNRDLRVNSVQFEYYHCDRTHYGLGKDTPIERPVQPRPSKAAKVFELPRVGRLHHRYEWKEAG